MSFINLSLVCHKNFVDEISVLLASLNALSVSYFDAEDNPILEPLPGEIIYWENTKVVGLFTADLNIEHIKESIQSYLTKRQLMCNLTTELLPDRDWDLAWKQSIKPLKFGDNLWIYPTWHTPEMNHKAINIILNPGMAFGTGTHETTALCLEWIEKANLVNLSIIDYGCGSGILGIACAKLGANIIYAIDYDEQAIISTIENAQNNHINTNNLVTLQPEQLPIITVDVIIANILSGPIIKLAPKFISLLKPNGKLILSGILDTQVNDVIKAFGTKVKFEPITQKGDWVRLDGILQ